ncbi:RTX toxins and related Ca2+-binding proteins [uncultured Gammaproteobacteria bacterium]|nr:RTX toxins and related Ca2+-binding proteins [uncultured Gammaproteobacteria bacterium]
MQTKNSQTKTQKAVNQPKQETTPLIKHNSAVSDSSPIIDLDPMAGIQSSNSVTTGTIQIATGVAFDADIADITDTDIKTIKVVLGGAGLNETNDKLVLDAELALNADIAKVTGKTIGTVSGLEYSYTHASKTLIISKTSGAFDPADVAKVVEAIQLKNTDIASQLGTRVATITYTDTNGNESEPATASLSVALYRGFVINGEVAGDQSGFSVSSAGDINGDGLDDLIVGAFFADPNGKLSAGKSYVVFGKANSSAINLSAIADASNPTGGFVINGEARYDYSGSSVSNAGDVNGDGLDDLIVSGYQADPSGKSSAGKSYVIFGKTDTGAIDLANLGGDSKYVINYLGDKNANTLTGTSKDEIFVAGAGDDTLTGNGGMDVFNAGLGKDSILINASNISALEQTGAGNRARVDDGGGIDTLVLEGSDLTLDLTKISDRRIQDIEVIDITGSGDNTLKLNLDDLLHASSSTNILKVLGDSGDKVNAADFSDSTIDKTVDGITYDVYTHSDTNTHAGVELWVQQEIVML